MPIKSQCKHCGKAFTARTRIARYCSRECGFAAARLDLTGQTFERLTVVKCSEVKRADGRVSWECRCICGKVIVTTTANLRRGDTKSCGCRHGADLTGKTFGKLTAVRRAGVQSKTQGIVWECKCACGSSRNVTSKALTSDSPKTRIRNCGCSHNRRHLPFGQAARNDLLRQYIAGAKNRRLAWELTEEEATALFTSDCFYCGVPPSNVYPPPSKIRNCYGHFVYNGIDRADSAIGYTSSNCLPCCATCNVAKRLLSKERFILLAKAIAARHPR